MLNRKVLVIATTASLIAFGGFSSSVFAASATGNASATIVAPLSITEDVAMDFGSISPDGTSATTVTITPAGAVSSPDGAGIAGGAPAAGQFTVTGFGTLTYAVSYTGGNLTGPGANMAVSGFTDSIGGAGALAGGTETFTVGADLAVGINQTAGAYSGTYTVTVNYN